jgi:serine protease AprX
MGSVAQRISRRFTRYLSVAALKLAGVSTSAIWLTLSLSLLLCLGGPGSPAFTRVAAAADVERIDPELKRQMAADPVREWPVIVEMQPARPPYIGKPNEVLARQALALLSNYGRKVGALELINSAAGFANAAAITAISLDPRVAFVHADSIVRPASTLGSTVALASAYPRAINADGVWQRGPTGVGPTVAVLDSGIAADEDLTQPKNRLLAAVNFAGDRGGLADAGGHGTHVAGIIAGNGYRSGGEYVGIAPGAGVVDVRVLNRAGYGRISSVVRGIEWVVANRIKYNIRAINLSLGMPALTSYRLDPLCAAVEIAWRRGLVVIAAAGNGGPDAGTVQSPGIDPYVITVGATDDGGSADVGDDILASFSAWGTPPDSTPKPDVAAPGRRIVSLRVPGSYLDVLYPDRLTTANTGATYFRLTGTSSATAVVTGAASLLLQQQPGLTPNRVKEALTSTTQPYGWAAVAMSSVNPSADGHGLIDSLGATYTVPRTSANQRLRPADTFARSIYPIVYGAPLTWNDPGYAGIDWNRLRWDNLAWDNLAWDNLAWDNLAWDNLAWDNLAWDNLAWDNLAWDNLAWDNLAWDNLAWDSGQLD